MSVGETFGRTIQLFLVDGTPIGLRKATIHGWTGMMFIAGDSAFAKLTAREEVDRTGIYLLLGPDPTREGERRVYIGSGNSVSERIRQSADKRTFWETAFPIVTSDDDLSKGHAEYLEARLIEDTAKAGRVNLDNGTKPDTARRRLPEADIANMEQSLANLRVLLPVVGLDMLKPQPKAVRRPEIMSRSDGEDPVRFEMRHKSGISAFAVEEDGEFVVLEGSEVLAETGYVQQSYAKLKERLITDGVLMPREGGGLRFCRPYSFASPSAASAVILDRNSNGRIEWKVAGSKETYADWQERQVERKEAAE